MGKRKRRQNLPRPRTMYAPCYNGSLAFSPNKEEAERTERIFQEARAERARERDEIDEMAQEDKPALEPGKAEVAAMEKRTAPPSGALQVQGASSTIYGSTTPLT